MPLFRRVPLAWSNLTHDRRKFVVSLLGIGFATMLMFVQIGFRNALLDASVAIVEELDAEVLILSKSRYSLAVRDRFTLHRLEQARAIPGVADAFPMYLEPHGNLWRDTDAGKDRFTLGEPAANPIRVIAFDPDRPVFRSPEIRKQSYLLRETGSVLMDRLSKQDFGMRAAGIRRELAGGTIHVVGLFTLGTDFTSEGTLLMSDMTYKQLLSSRLSPISPLGSADIGLVKLAEGADPEAVRDALNLRLPDDVKAFTRDEYVAIERGFWQSATPIGVVFAFGVAMGLLVGSVICFQILSADVSDHLKEYATLKAIGYTNGELSRVVLAQAAWLSFLAFWPALILSLTLYQVLGHVTGLPLRLTLGRGLFVFMLASGMCMASGMLALRRIKSADPAEVF
ncbi:MAG: ABC transporter permease DevC [Gemmataceae bacterium]|nr:ABC transporter permease DevC [Gemmataceae bacterium]